MQVEVGAVHTHEFEVEDRHTADALGNPGVFVLGTPYVLLFMELTSQYLLQRVLGEATVSVGVSANFRHMAATPRGDAVRVTTEVTEVDRRRFGFRVFAEDSTRRIAEGDHERFLIDDLDAFLAKTVAR